jgi:hypothetical protein
LASAGAFEALRSICWSWVRPVMLFGSERVETHFPFSFLARSPPLAKIHEIPLRQS